MGYLSQDTLQMGECKMDCKKIFNSCRMPGLLVSTPIINHF